MRDTVVVWLWIGAAALLMTYLTLLVLGASL
jgi:hypothetical protein